MLSKNVDLNNTVILVTGAAGFVGANLVMSLLSEAEGTQIIGIDSVNDYYDVALKDYRLQQIEEISKDNKNTWIFKKGNIADKAFIEEIFSTYKPRVVVNLAAYRETGLSTLWSVEYGICLFAPYTEEDDA